METKQFLDLESLKLYDTLLKKNVDAKIAAKVPDIWEFRASYNRSVPSVVFTQVKKNGELFTGNLSAYAITNKDNAVTNMMSVAANKTFTDGAYTANINQSAVNFLDDADTLVFKIGSADGSSVYAASYTVPLKTSSIGDGVSGFTTGDQVYDYVQANLSGYAQVESLADVATSGSYEDLEDKPFEEVSSEFPLVSIHLADGEGHEGEIVANNFSNAVYTITPSESLVYSDPEEGWPELELVHRVWEGDEGQYNSMYFQGPDLDLSEYVSSLEDLRSMKLRVNYNGTSYLLPLQEEYGITYYSAEAGQPYYFPDQGGYAFEYPFSFDFDIQGEHDEETGENILYFDSVSLQIHILCNQPFDLDFTFERTQISQLDEKFIPSTIARTSDIPVVTTATAVADGDTGYATGDQVYDYVQANKGEANVIEGITLNGSSDGVTVTNKIADLTVSTDADVQVRYRTVNIPQTVSFVEVEPGTGYSSNVITSYV